MRGSSPSPRVIRFGPFEADLHAGELRKHGLRIKLQEQPFQILDMLLERPGEVITREELQKKLWPADTFVDFDHGLGSAINKLRQALGDSAENPRYIETLPRRGFRFLAAADAVRGRSEPAVTRAWVWVAAGVVFIALGVSGYLAWQGWHARRAPPGRVMLVVLPFENLSSDPDQEFFSDGMTEEMITQLGGLDPQRLGVIARASAMQYKHSTKGAAQIGRELGVDYLLEGSARRAGGRVRITAQLIQVRDETNQWAESYEGDLRDILVLQRDVAAAIAQQIRLALSADTRARLTQQQPVVPEAHEAYLKGLYFWNKFTNPNFHKSIEYFQEAIEKDPAYAPAYAGLAASYVNLAQFGEPPSDFYPKSEAAARKALAIDETSSQGHAVLSWSLMYYHHDWGGAERALLRALELNPSDSYARMLYANYLTALGRFDQAREQIERARQTDPVSLVINVVVAQVLFYQRQYDAALAQLAKTREMDPNFPPTYWTLAHVYEALGKDDEACQYMLKTFDLGSGHVPWFAQLENLGVRSGWRAAWQEWIKGMLEPQAQGEYVQPYDLVEAYLDLGHDEDAIEWLRKAAEVRDVEIVFINMDPRFDRLRTNPRFQEIVRSLNFPQ
jgi:TolB-like protein/DNA-binding winged helix-turn-helix (wHTH) protein/uncharacterized protein HemY